MHANSSKLDFPLTKQAQAGYIDLVDRTRLYNMSRSECGVLREVPIATIPGHREKRNSKTPGKKPRKCFIKTKEHQTVYNIMREFDPPARADSKLRWKTGARFKITHNQKHNLESVPPQQKNHEGIRELDLACDQKSPASPAASKEPVRRIQLHFRSTCFCFTPPIYLR